MFHCASILCQYQAMYSDLKKRWLISVRMQKRRSYCLNKRAFTLLMVVSKVKRGENAQ